MFQKINKHMTFRNAGALAFFGALFFYAWDLVNWVNS